MDKSAKATEKEIARLVDESIVYEGKRIVLPEGPPRMTARQAANALMAKAKEEEQTVEAYETIQGNPFDGLVALQATLKEMFGWSTIKGTTVQGFFGPRQIPAQILDVRTGPNPEDVIQVPVGDISAPGLDFAFQAHPTHEGLVLQAELKKYQAEKVKEIASATRAYLKNNSIYKNKAFEMPRNNMEQPTFLSFSHMREEELILSGPIEDSVQVNVLTPIRHTEALKRDGIPVKRTVVLAGKYGTGKSMTLATTSKIALENGWTVIYLKDTERLVAAVEQAKRQQPCLIVAEDVDQVTATRDKESNDIFNVLSGVLSGDMDIEVLMTTNHPERIDKAMIRPGRIDALIEVLPPDAEAVERLVALYGRGLIDTNGKGLTKVGAMLAGQIPATIREVVERSKLARIATGTDKITEEALIKAVHSMGPQLELLNAEKAEEVPTLDKALRKALIGVMRDAVLDANGKAMTHVYASPDRARLFDEMPRENKDLRS